MSKMNGRVSPAGTIPKDWNVRTLERVAEVEYGISDPLDKILSSGVRIIGLQNVSQDGIYYDDPKLYVRAEQLRKDSLLKRGDILFCWRSGSKEHIGKTYLYNLNDEYTHVGFLLRIRSDLTKINPTYLDAYIKYIKNRGYFLGSKVQVNSTFNKGELLQLPIVVPPLAEQRKIAEILGTWDAAIATVEQLIAALRERKRGLMQRLLTGEVRFPGFEGEWEEVRLGDVFQRITRRNDVRNENVLTASAQYGLVSQTDYFKRNVASASLKNYYLLYKGDFVYNRSYSEGYPFGAIKQLEDYEIGVLSPLYLCFCITHKAANRNFYKHFFEAGGMNRGIYSIAQEGARNHGLLNVSVSHFFNLVVPFPSLQEQNCLAELFDRQDQLIKLSIKHRDRLRQQKKGLMQRLLTGQVRASGS